MGQSLSLTVVFLASCASTHALAAEPPKGAEPQKWAEPLELAEPALRLYGSQLILPLLVPSAATMEKLGIEDAPASKDALFIHLSDLRMEPGEGEALAGVLSGLRERGGKAGAVLAERLEALASLKDPEERLPMLLEILSAQEGGEELLELVKRIRVEPTEEILTFAELNPELYDVYPSDFGDLWGVHLRPGTPPWLEQLRDPLNGDLRPWMRDSREVLLNQPCVGLITRPPPPEEDRIFNARVTAVDGFRAELLWEAHALQWNGVTGPEVFHVRRQDGPEYAHHNSPFLSGPWASFQHLDEGLIPTRLYDYCITAERNGLEVAAARLFLLAPDDAPPPVTGLTATVLSPREVLLQWQPMPSYAQAALSHYELWLDDRREVARLEPTQVEYLADPRSLRGDHTYRLVAHWLWNWNTSEGSAPIHGIPRLQGVADLHAHQFANLGFGGRILHGSPAGPESGLGSCTSHGTDPFDSSRAADLINLGASGDTDRLSHLKAGFPDFNEWPRHDDLTHQQMHKDWLRRAWEGGLRLMVNLAVNNQTLCMVATLNGQGPAPGRSCDDMENALVQIDAAWALQAEIDTESGGPGRGWYRIVTSASQAREVILEGKLAVVLGLEVDQLFGCRQGVTCDAQYLRQQIAQLRSRGVRHVFPIHLVDNAFGGAAIYRDEFNLSNAFLNGNFFSVLNCDTLPNPTTPSIQFQLFAVPPSDGTLGGLIESALSSALTPSIYPNVPHCNTVGLTSMGTAVMTELMNQGMIIDIDHMGDLATQSALSFAEPRGYPLVAGHTWFNAQALDSVRAHEANLDDNTLDRLTQLGGMVGVIVEQGSTTEQATFTGVGPGQAVIPNDCSNSGSSWVQAYRHAVSRRGGRPVALGSDFNGMLKHPTPRFNRLGEDDACDGAGARSTGMVSYPFTDRFGTFDRHTAGVRVFDINFDGLATVGQLPDFIQSLRVLGITEEELNPLYESADGYLEMWEKAERVSGTGP